nr:MAG TPA: hypothetical protein [Caudoviricetes sp.]
MEYLKCVMKILLQRHIVPTCGMKLLKPSRIMRTALRQLSNGAGDSMTTLSFRLLATIMVPGRATLARVPRICRTSCSRMIGVGLSLAITRTTRPSITPKNLRFSTVLGFSLKSLAMRFPNCLRSEVHHVCLWRSCAMVQG